MSIITNFKDRTIKKYNCSPYRHIIKNLFTIDNPCFRGSQIIGSNTSAVINFKKYLFKVG